MILAHLLEKVTAFITRGDGDEAQLLLLSHPYAGNQFPAGTVEPGERADAAVLREVGEETGLTQVALKALVGTQEHELPANLAAVHLPTLVFSRPDPGSFQWASFPRGIVVEVTGRHTAGYVQVQYREYDRFPESQYVTMEIAGWVAEAALTGRIRRYYYHLTSEQNTEPSWQVSVDNHVFSLFWATMKELPALVSPHDEWLSVFQLYWKEGQSVG